MSHISQIIRNEQEALGALETLRSRVDALSVQLLGPYPKDSKAEPSGAAVKPGFVTQMNELQMTAHSLIISINESVDRLHNALFDEGMAVSLGQEFRKEFTSAKGI